MTTLYFWITSFFQCLDYYVNEGAQKWGPDIAGSILQDWLSNALTQLTHFSLTHSLPLLHLS